MRPTDENQHGSTRPNLMSASRPGGSEDNILAMLERDAGRGRKSQFSSHPRLAWYAGAGTVVMAMVGALGWLAWENANKLPELTVETTLVLPAGETSVAAGHDAHLRTASLTAAAAERAVVVTNDPPLTQTAGAAIVDSPATPVEAPVLLAQAGPPPQTSQPSRLPPLVLLPPEEAGPKRAPAAAHAAAQPKAQASKPDQSNAAPGSRAAGKTDAAPRTLAKPSKAASPRLAARRDAASSTRPAVKAATVAQGRPSAKAALHRAPKNAATRARKSSAVAAAAPAAKAQDAAADGDVALISAIIMHSSRHAAERAKADPAKNCEGAKCPGKAAAK